ncbi:potassium-transporting ATPase subunit F [Listeria aquatica]|uniref:Potassium-transporting ATPase subunit F n=1 Tax=Listeria aquatica TaxID=1494960 RepID=A0A841ZSH8_9LIST|nr:potassium-transporting ATPase subunit F [Listeria aquatica]
MGKVAILIGIMICITVGLMIYLFYILFRGEDL